MLKNLYMMKTKDEATVEKEYFVQCEGSKICIKNNRDYTRTHIWTKITQEGNLRIGVTDYAQKHLKEKVGLVEIFKNTTTGEEVEAGEVFGTIYGRAFANLDEMRCEYMAFDIIAPISGRIVNINPQIMETPEIINNSPYEKGWIATIVPKHENDLSYLMTAKAYKKLLEKKEDAPFRVL